MGGVISITTAAVSSQTVLAGLRALKKGSNPQDSTGPAILFERGSQISYLLGFDSMPGFLGWEEYGYTVAEAFAGGAGGKGIGAAPGGDNLVEYRKGQHFVAIGPASRLRRIIQNGKVIWPLRGQHPHGITPDDAPSGSGFDCRNAENGGSEGHFRWYWGEIDQPVDTLFSDGSAKGVISNDGFTCFAVWDSKRLSGPATWPVVEFEIEVRPYSDQMLYNGGASWDPNTVSQRLAGSAPWIEGYPVSDESKASYIYETSNSPSTVTVLGNQTADYPSGELCELRGTNVDGSYECVQSTFTPGTVVIQPTALQEILANLSAVSSFSAGSLTLSTSTGAPSSTAGGINVGTSGFPSFPGYGVPDDIYLVRNRITRNSGSVDLYLDYSATSPGPYHPAGAGGARRLGIGTHVFTIYLWKDVSYSCRFRMGFNVVGGTYKYVELEKDSTGGDVTVISLSSGISFSKNHLSASYLQLTVKYTVPDPEVGELYTQRIELHDGIGATSSYNFRYIACAKTSVTSPFFGHTTLVEGSSGSTEIELFGLPAQVTPYKGQILPMSLTSEDIGGANMAHVVYQLLTLPRPHGVGNHSAIIDGPSLEALGAQLQSEGIRSHYLVTGGNNHSSILERALYEVLVNCQWDAVSGLWRFEALRQGSADFKLDPKMLLSNDVDSTGFEHSSKSTNIVYRYRDMMHNLSPLTVRAREDGGVDDTIGQTLERTDLDTVRDVETAKTLAKILYMIEASSPVLRSVGLCRDAASLRVGDFIDCDQLFDEGPPLMVKSLQPRAGSLELPVGLVSTPFAESSLGASFSVLAESPPVVNPTISPDAAQRVFELSGHLTEHPTVLALRVPTGNKASKALAYFSRDGVSYEYAGSVRPSTGGYVVGELSPPTATTLDYWGQDDAASMTQADGPVIRVFDPGFSSKIRVLSDDQLSSGDQWLIVGREVMFVRRFEPHPSGSDLWQAKDVIRGRYEHGVESNLHGLAAFVVQKSALPVLPISVEKSHTNVVRFQEQYKDLQTSLADAEPHNISLVGLAATPVFVGGFEQTGLSGWAVGSDVNLVWDYANRDTMAMAKAVDIQTRALAEFEGRFFVDVYGSAAPTVSILQVEGSRYGSATVLGSDIESALIGAGQSSTSNVSVVLTAVGVSGVAANVKGGNSIPVPHLVV